MGKPGAWGADDGKVKGIREVLDAPLLDLDASDRTGRFIASFAVTT